MNSIEELIIEGTPKTPHIDLNPVTGDLIITGKSIPENAAKVYDPVLNWAQNYIQNPRPTTNIRLNLEYFNTASSIWLAKVLKVLVKINIPDYVLFIHIYLAIEDFDEMNEIDDIKEAFGPIADILTSSTTSLGLKVYGTADDGEVIKERLVFI
jgi:hypothetical protein